MFAVLMLEEIKNTHVLHQPGNKIKVCLAILDAILSRLIRAGQRTLEIAETRTGEYQLDDVGNRHVLENAAIRIAREKPQPGHDLHLVVGEASIGAALGEAADETIEVTQGLIGQGDADGDILTDNVVEGDGIIGRQKFQVES